MKPWMIRQDESAKAHAAFQAYCDLGPDRSLERLHQSATVPTPVDTLKRWSSRFDWAARVRAFDEAAAAKAADRALEDAAAVRSRQAQHAKAIQIRAMQKIAGMDPGDMSMAEATRAWQVGAEAERKALGIADRVDLGGDVGIRVEFAYEDGADDDGGAE